MLYFPRTEFAVALDLLGIKGSINQVTCIRSAL
jgi:hypothetical protein